MKPMVSKAIMDMVGILERLIGKGIKLGEFSGEVNVSLEARKFFAGINGAVLMSRVTGDHSILQDIIEDMRQQIMNW
jgi:hypothetical protein